MMHLFKSIRKPRLNRKLLVFLFFVLLSAIFWFLSALGREYTTRLSYPVRYTNYPDNMVLVGELPSSLDLTVNAYGYTLMKYYIGRRLLPIVFDVNSFSLSRMPDTETMNFYILTSLARTRIAGQLGADIDIIDIEPDTLYFSFTEMISRVLPVRSRLDLEFESQFMVNGNIAVDPDSVTVYGPASVIDTMQFVGTAILAISGINESLTRSVDLTGHQMLEFSEATVLVTIPVGQFTEASLKVPVEAIGLPDTLTMKTFPADITVSYLVALSDYEKVTPAQFRAVVEYEIPPPATGRLPVKLLKQPEFIRAVRFIPQSVDYIIER